MGTYLEDNPPKIPQFRRPRRTVPSGVVVVHTAESFPDEVGPDSGAENVARFIVNRTNYGSYHDLCDSDTTVYLVPYDAEAYGDGTGSNPHAYHVSGATQAAKWHFMPKTWTYGTVRNMARASARYAKWLEKTHKIKIPARRITKPQSDARVPGFISHAERDPDRRSDPGKDFPWGLFFSFYNEFMGYNIEEDEVDEAQEDRIADKAARRVLNELGVDDPDNAKNRTLAGSLTEVQRDLNLIMDHLGIANPH